VRIENSSLHLTSQRSASEQRVRRESLRVWVGARRPDFEGQGTPRLPGEGSPRDTVVVSDAARQKLSAAAGSPTPAKRAERAAGDDDAALDPRTRLLKLIVERLTGRRIRLLSLDDVRPQDPGTGPDAVSPEQRPAEPALGFGVEYDLHESYRESESVSFSAEGVVNTADGKQISFRVALNMSREFAREVDVSIRAGDAARQKKDPLVVNFDGTAAQLSDARFAFDLDADGSAERVPFVGPGSAFLALDRNGDGQIGDGGELFGPSTGNGFAELAAYDQDRNGWIDENDPVYAQLLTWSKDASGSDSLATLKEGGVGAIYLGAVETQFDVRDQRNDVKGQVRSTSVYLREDGSAGTVQQIDLAT